MGAHARHLECVPAPHHGRDTIVKQVMLRSRITSLGYSYMYNYPTAVCDPPCKNGGTCASPGQCSCPTGWTGDQCELGSAKLYMP